MVSRCLAQVSTAAASTAVFPRESWSFAAQVSVWFVLGLTIWMDSNGAAGLQLENISAALMREFGSHTIRQARERCRCQLGKHSRARNPDLP
jgi:hypothetical protein